MNIMYIHMKTAEVGQTKKRNQFALATSLTRI